jgi:hypothetical protein
MLLTDPDHRPLADFAPSPKPHLIRFIPVVVRLGVQLHNAKVRAPSSVDMTDPLLKNETRTG